LEFEGVAVAVSDVDAYGYGSVCVDGLVELSRPLVDVFCVLVGQVEERFVALAEK